jgi:hypothetical protein
MSVIATPTTLSPTAIREHAAVLGELHDIYGPEGAADVDKLFSTLGGFVTKDVPSGHMSILGRGAFAISPLGTGDHLGSRQAKAHAIGHYLLHYRLMHIEASAHFSCSHEVNEAESQANLFAAALLTRAADFVAAFNTARGDVQEISAKFGVYTSAIARRAESLGMTSR